MVFVAVVSLLNQKSGVGKTTLSIHLAAALADSGKVLLIDADPQGSALDWQAQRTGAASFSVVGLPKPTLHREVAALGKPYDWIVIDGPPRAAALAKSAIAASDLVLVPVQPSPFDVWAAQDILYLLRECAVLRPGLKARFVVNRLFVGTRLAAEVNEALAGFEVPILRVAAQSNGIREGRARGQDRDRDRARQRRGPGLRDARGRGPGLDGGNGPCRKLAGAPSGRPRPRGAHQARRFRRRQGPVQDQALERGHSRRPACSREGRLRPGGPRHDGGANRTPGAALPQGAATLS